MDNKEMLGHAKVGKLLFKLATPAILAQLINVLYNVVDRLFIAGLHDGAITSGLTVCFPILMLVSAFSALAGMAGAPLASIELGKGNTDKAERIMNNSFVMLMTLAVILTTIFEIFPRQILGVFGAKPEFIDYATDYLVIYMAGTIFVLLALGLNNFISAQGFSKTSMLSVVIGAVSNIILDPILIYGCKLGIRGAAIATITSQAISAVWIICFLCGKKTMLRLRFSKMKPNVKIMLSILALGISPFIMQSTESLVQMTFNNGLGKYLEPDKAVEAIAGMGVLFTIMQMTTMPLMGLAQGGQPIISYNYGARNMERVKSTFKYLLVCSSIFLAVVWILVMSIPSILSKPLSPTPAALEFASGGLRIFMAGSIMFFLQFSCQQSLVALGQSKVSLFLALFRKVLLLVPLAIVLPMLMTNKVLGLLIAEPIADVIAALVTFATFMIVFKKLNREVKASIDRDNIADKIHKEEIAKLGEVDTATNDSTTASEQSSK